MSLNTPNPEVVIPAGCFTKVEFVSIINEELPMLTRGETGMVIAVTKEIVKEFLCLDNMMIERQVEWSFDTQRGTIVSALYSRQATIQSMIRINSNSKKEWCCHSKTAHLNFGEFNQVHPGCWVQNEMPNSSTIFFSPIFLQCSSNLLHSPKLPHSLLIWLQG